VKAGVRHPLIRDQLLTPRASFHTTTEIKRWSLDAGVGLVKHASTGYTPPYFLRDYGQLVYYYGVKIASGGGGVPFRKRPDDH